MKYLFSVLALTWIWCLVQMEVVGGENFKVLPPPSSVNMTRYNVSEILTALASYDPVKIALNLLTHLQSTTVVTPAMQDIEYYAHFSASAYCNDPELSNWKCMDCIATGATKFVRAFRDATSYNQAYLAINHVREEVIVAYRGTVAYRNIIQDLRGDLVVIGRDVSGREIRAHRGTWEGVYRLHEKAGLRRVLHFLIRHHPKYRVILTGHSLGGLLASLGYFNLKNDPGLTHLNYSIYAYGSPRVGDMEFSKWFNAQNVTGIRVVWNDDFVPHLALVRAGYVHHLRELWIRGLNHTFCDPILLEDPACSNSLRITNYKFLNHLTYMGITFPPIDCVLANPRSYLRNLIF